MGGILFWDHWDFSQNLELTTLDLRYRNFNRATQASDAVVVVEIDERSLKLLANEYGRWPWPRIIYKNLIEYLSQAPPAGVLFDLLFTEPQLNSDHDHQLAVVSGAAGFVSHAMVFTSDRASGEAGKARLPMKIRNHLGIDKIQEISGHQEYHTQGFYDFAAPSEIYLDSIQHVHVVNAHIDPDGVYRRMPLAFRYDGTWLSSITLKALYFLHPSVTQLTVGRDKVTIASEHQRFSIPLDSDNFLPVHFYQKQKGPKIYSIADLLISYNQMLNGEIEDPEKLLVNPAEFSGKVVLVGSSAVGLSDLKATPIDPGLPGVMLHATAISNVLKNDYLARQPWGWRIFVGLAFILGIYACVFLIENIFLKLTVPVLALALYELAAVWLFQYHSLWLDMSLPMVAGMGALLGAFTYLTFSEGRERKRMKATLSKYVSPAVIDQLVDSGQDPAAEVGSTEELSILFADIRGFTTLSERLPAKVVVCLLNEYLGQMTNVIFDHHGTLDKFIGDAILAFWGAPLRDEDHALRSVQCGLAMKRGLLELKAEWLKRGQRQTMDIGIGINTGVCIVGNIGSVKKLEYTVIGDNVNLASRLEGLTKQYRLSFLIGEKTYELVKDKIHCRSVDRVVVKGKSAPVNIFEPLCALGDPNEGYYLQLKSTFEQGFDYYKRGLFFEAIKAFESLQAQADLKDSLSSIFIERCLTLQESRPNDWEGIYYAKSK